MALTAARVEAVAGAMVNEADARESALREVQLALSRSQEASQSFAQYSEQVTSQMEDAFERFGDGTVSVLERTLTNFDKELTSAVTLLGDVLERLAQYAADKDERIEKANELYELMQKAMKPLIERDVKEAME